MKTKAVAKSSGTETILIDRLKVAVVKLSADGERAMALASAVTIKNDEDEKRAIEVGIEVKAISDEMESQYKVATEPFNKAVEKIRGWFSTPRVNAKEAIVTVKGKIAHYRDERERIRREEETKRLLVYQEQQRKIREEAEKENRTVQVSAPPPMILPASGVTKTNGGASAQTRYVLKVRIVAPSLVPREFCVPSESLIRKAGEAGISVPGVEFTREQSIAFKS